MSTPVSDAPAPIASIGERGLIRLIRDRFPAPPGVLQVGIGDDAAVAPPVRGELPVLTTDALVEGVHFDLRFSSFEDVGYKALAVNVSDLAAMGATPHLALLSLILPARLMVADVEGLLDGFAAMAAESGITLAGGNITTSPGPLVVDVTAIGHVRPRKVLTRAGGRPGDGLFVTGTIGAAAAGLQWLRDRGRGPASGPDDDMAPLVERYRRPSPRVRIGTILGRSRAASACMDLSDGLADAVRQIAEASGTGATVAACDIPVPEAARRWYAAAGRDPVREALAGGDDYELLFTAPARRRGRLRTVLQQSRGVPVTRIGELTADQALVFVRDGRAEPLPNGFTHF